MADHTQEAERAAPALTHEQVMEILTQGVVTEKAARWLRNGYHISLNLDDLTLFANKFARRAPVQSADTGVDGLPQREQPYVVKIHKFGKKWSGRHEYELSDGSIQDLNELEALMSAAKHANSLRAKDAEIAQLRAELASGGAAQGRITSIDSDEFRIVLDNWAGALHSCDHRTRTVYAKQAYNALIAHIDAWAGQTQKQATLQELADLGQEIEKGDGK